MDSTYLKDPIVWIDLEMTGLDLKKDKIIEIAVVITNGHLTKQINGPNLIIKCDNNLIDNMDEWCTNTHQASGLVQKVKESDLDLIQAETQVLDFLKIYIHQEKKAPLAGNSVHVDRQFLYDQMPKLIQFLSYRIIDVSSIKEIYNRWYPNMKGFYKKGSHRALDDIEESIQELKFFKKKIFK